MGNVSQGSFPAPKSADDSVKAPKPAAKSEDE
jgi:hypothetical protein